MKNIRLLSALLIAVTSAVLPAMAASASSSPVATTVALAVSPGPYAYTSTTLSGRVAADPRVGSLSQPGGPDQTVVDSRGLWIVGRGDLVAGVDPSTLVGRLMLINPVTGALVMSVPAGHTALGTGLAVDGTDAWVSSYADDSISEISETTGAIVRTVSLGPPPLGGSVAQMGVTILNGYVWVAVPDSGGVAEISPSTGALLHVIRTDTQATGLTNDGSHVWVANSGADSISEIDPATATVISTISDGASPLALTSDGTNVWESSADGTVARITIATHAVTSVAHLTPGPYGLTGISLANGDIVVAGSAPSDVTVLTPALVVITSVSTGGLASSSAGSGSSLWVADPASDTLSELDLSVLSMPLFGSVSITDTITASAGSVSTLTFAPRYISTSGIFTIDTVDLPPGRHVFTATFTPTGTAAAGSTSPAQTIDLGQGPCPGSPTDYASAGLSATACQDSQPVSTTVTPGYITISTPYTAAAPYVLPSPVLNPVGTQLAVSAPFPAVTDPPLTISSTLAGDPDWTATCTSSGLVGTGVTTAPGQVDTINPANIGLTGWTEITADHSNPAMSVTFVNHRAAGGIQPGAAPPPGTTGLYGAPVAFAYSTGGGDGTIAASATLSLVVPTNTVADTYTGTIVFSVS